MTQIFVNLLASLKKANAATKQKMAEKNGFKTPAEFMAYLQSQITPPTVTVHEAKKEATVKKNPKKTVKVKTVPTIHNVHILDESGSMSGPKYKSAVEGINGELKKLKADKTVNYTQTLVGFSGNTQIIEYFFMKPIQEVTEFKGMTYGSTALNDAVGKTLTSLLEKANGTDKFIVTIFTDGGENDSRKFNSTQIAKLIKKAEDKGFTITFIGTKFDVQQVESMYSLSAGNSLVHENTAESIGMSFATRSTALQTYTENVKKGKAVKSGFFKKTGKL